MALKVLVGPLRYVQGPNALSEMDQQLQALAIRKPLVLVSRSAKKVVEPIFAGMLEARRIIYELLEFGGECTFREIDRVKNACIEGCHDAIIGCGGGKTLDTGRAAAAAAAVMVEKSPPEALPRFGAGVPYVSVPTVAATDAATSAVSLVYTEEGIAETALAFPTNPTMVLVDTGIIARSPVRLIVAGMGDALATHFEAAVSLRTGTPCIQTSAHSTLTAQALARLCLDIILDYGVHAKAEAEAGIPGPGIEAIAEANVFLSGLGFESGGLSAAHAIGLAFHHINECFETHMYHGELVAFGTLTQLILEERKPEYLDTIFGFCKAVGLPTTFGELNLGNVTDEELLRVADAASRHVIIRSMPGGTAQPDREGRFYDHLTVFRAMKTADAYGRAFDRTSRR